MSALYIHWPFCKKKCPYCDFNSHVRNQIAYEDWQKAMLQEMQHMAEIASVSNISSIFFGGGTPSLMPPSLIEALINQAEQIWGFANNIEITLEANPTSFEASKFAQFKQAGINRLSIGIQALNDEDLKFLGREHSAKEALQVLSQANAIFERISFDLIYARPNQTAAMWELELKQALQLANGHISLYQLTIEPETPFERLYARGDFTLPNAQTCLNLYEITENSCASQGLQPYEVSNYAAPNQQSEHNLTYWRGEDYLGVGAGAHGRIINREGKWVATQTYKSPERWLENALKKGNGIEALEELTHIQRAEEILLCGLRLREGIELEKVRPALNLAKFELLQQMNLLTMSQGRLIVTKQGLPVLEKIASELILC